MTMHTTLSSSVRINPSREELQRDAIQNNEGKLSRENVLTVLTGKRTGRSPKDRYIIENDAAKSVNWGKINQRFSPDHFSAIWQKALSFLDEKPHYHSKLHVGANSDHALPLHVYTETAWHHLFAKNMFIETEAFIDDPKRAWTIVNVPSLTLSPDVDHTNSDGGVFIDFADQRILLAGMRYAGEMKKAAFSALNFILPQKDILPMHCSGTQDHNGVVSLYFGLSGTGKTTLSSDPDSFIIGDDEHGWSKEGVFNFEGGCYAKCINLTAKREPIIVSAIKTGAVMENVHLDEQGNPDFTDTRNTQNTRVAYPRSHIDKKIESNQAGHPQHLIFLCCDLYGVLPPVAELTLEQAAYYFLSGYTALVGSTEMGQGQGIKPTFSTCFGAPFFPRKASTYSDLLMKRIQETEAKVYLVNTGWHGGPYGAGGERYELNFTRKIIRAINEGTVAQAEKTTLPLFNINIPKAIDGLDSHLLDPRKSWSDEGAYEKNARELIRQFQENSANIDVDASIIQAGPQDLEK